MATISATTDQPATDQPVPNSTGDAGAVPHAAAHHKARHHHAVRHSTEIAHHTRGRVRLKIPTAKHNPALLEQIKAAFTDVPGIDGIELKPASGSVVLLYDPDHHPDIPSLFHSIGGPPVSAAPPPPPAHHRPPEDKISEATRRIEDEAEFLAEHSHTARVFVEFAKDLDRRLKRATNNNIDLKILVPFGLAAFTFLEIGAAAATPMWVTLVIFSLNHFVELHAHETDEAQPT